MNNLRCSLEKSEKVCIAHDLHEYHRHTEKSFHNDHYAELLEFNQYSI